MFAAGDRVVYPLHGGAIVKEVQEREQNGKRWNIIFCKCFLKA